MTDTTAMRDELARVCGWTIHSDRIIQFGLDCVVKKYSKSDTAASQCHPFPDSDLNALAAVWPDDDPVSVYRRRHGDGWRWSACADNRSHTINHQDGDTEYAARLALTLAVLKAGEPDHA